MRRFLLITVLLVLPCRFHAAEEDIEDFSPGYFSYYHPLKLPKGACTDCLNVYAKPTGELSAVPGAYVIEPVAPDGSATGLFVWKTTTTDYGVLFTTNGSVYTNEGGSWTFRGGGFSTTERWSCAAARNRLYCSNRVDVPIVIFATAPTQAVRRVNTIPSGGCLAYDRERLCVACVSSATTANGTVQGDPSTLYLSNYYDLEDFSIDATSASKTESYYQPIGQGDNQIITGLIPYASYLVIGKENSLWTKTGTDNSNWNFQRVPGNIGLTYNQAWTISDGMLWGASRLGIWKWNRAGAPVVISERIRDEWNLVKQLNSARQTWVEDNDSDWILGISTPFGILNSTRTSGSIRLASGTYVDDFADGDYTSGNAAWTAAGSGSLSIQNGMIDLLDTSVAQSSPIIAWTRDRVTFSSGNWYATLDGVQNGKFFMAISSWMPSDITVSSFSYKLEWERSCAGGTNNVTLYQNGTVLHQLPAVGVLDCSNPNVTIKIGRTASGHTSGRITLDPSKEVAVASNVPSVFVSTISYLILGWDRNTGSNTSARFDNIIRQEIDISTWYSPVKQLTPSVAVWGTRTDDIYNPDSIYTTYYYRTSATSFASGDATPAWTQMTNGTQLTGTVGNYIQIATRFEWQVPFDDLRLDKRTTAWTTSAGILPIVAGSNDGRVFFSVASASDSVNDRTYMIDHNLNFWPIKGLWTHAMVVYGTNLWSASGKDSFTRKIWQEDAPDFGNNEWALPHWKSKLFYFNNIHSEKTVKDMRITTDFSRYSRIDATLEVDNLNQTVWQSSRAAVIGVQGTGAIFDLRPTFSRGQFNGKVFRFGVQAGTKNEGLRIYNIGIFYDESEKL